MTWASRGVPLLATCLALALALTSCSNDGEPSAPGSPAETPSPSRAAAVDRPDDQYTSARRACDEVVVAVARGQQDGLDAAIPGLARVVQAGIDAPVVGDAVAEVGAAGASADATRLNAALRALLARCEDVPGW